MANGNPLTLDRILATSLPPLGNTKDLYGAAPTGFAVRLSPHGPCTFWYGYRFENEKRRYTIARYPRDRLTERHIAKAQKEAYKLEDRVEAGDDPHGAKMERKDQERRAAELGVTLTPKSKFKVAVGRFIELYAKPRQRTWKETERTLLVNCAPWLNRRLDQITKADARALLEGFVAEGHPYKATLTLSWLRTFWRWLAKRDAVAYNFMPDVEIHIERQSRERWYKDDEIKSLWRAADQLDPLEGGYLKLILLTGVRRGELAGMRRCEFDDAEKPALWTVPHERTKSKKNAKIKRVYKVPLSPLAQRVLRGLPRFATEGHERAGILRDLVFPGRHHGKPLSPSSPLVRKIIEKSCVKDFHFHACRHTVATWLQNQGASTYERGLVLNHSDQGVTAGYSHGAPVDLKRDLLEKWSAHVEGLISQAGTVALR